MPHNLVYDCIVIGGGHNGLVARPTLRAASRSGAGARSRRAQAGGAALTRGDSRPGFRVSAGAHLLHLMPAGLLRELRLESHGAPNGPRRADDDFGARARRRPLEPDPRGSGAGQRRPVRPGCAGVFGLCNGAHAAFRRRLWAPILARVPPRLGHAAIGPIVSRSCGSAGKYAGLGRRDMRELLRIGGMNVRMICSKRTSQSAALEGGAWDSMPCSGANFGPRSPGTVLTLLYRIGGRKSAAGGSGIVPAQGRHGRAVQCPQPGRRVRPAQRSAPGRRWRIFCAKAIVPWASRARIRASIKCDDTVISECRPEEYVSAPAGRTATSRCRLRAPRSSHIRYARAGPRTASGAESGRRRSAA